MGKTSNERSIKVAKAQKRSDVFYFVGRWPVFDSCDLCRVHACYPLFKDYSQVIDGRSMERALLRFEVQVVILCHCENILNSLNMIGKGCGRSDSYIVHVDSDDCSPDRVFRDDIFIDLIHHGLKCCRGVTESEKHDC